MRLPQKPNTTAILQTVFLVTLCLVTSIHLIAGSIPSTGPFYLHYPFGYSAYIGTFDDGNYFYIDGSNWESTVGTNTTFIFEKAITDNTDGGKVLLMAGEYAMTFTSYPNSNLIIEGEGDATVLEADSSWTWAVFNINDKENVTLRNMRIIRNAGTPALVYVIDSDDVTVENIHFEGNGYGVAIEVRGDSSRIRIRYNTIENFDEGIRFKGQTNKTIEDSSIYGNIINVVDRAGIRIRPDNLTRHLEIYNNKIVDFSSVYTGQGGIVVEVQGGSVPWSGIDISIHDNQLVSKGNEAASTCAIYVKMDDNATVSQISIKDNEVYGTSATAWGIGFESTPTANIAKDVTIEGNDVYSCEGGIRVGDCITATVVGNDCYYQTEWSFRINDVNSSILFSSNHAVDWGQVGASNPYGLWITNDNSSIIANTLYHSGSETCINITGDSDNNFLSSNMFSTGGTGLAIDNASANQTIVDGNNFFLCTTDVSDSGTNTIWGSNIDQVGNYDQGVEP